MGCFQVHLGLPDVHLFYRLKFQDLFKLFVKLIEGSADNIESISILLFPLLNITIDFLGLIFIDSFDSADPFRPPSERA